MENSEDNSATELGDSFRQSRKELWVIVVAWIVFFTWTFTYCYLKSGDSAVIGGIPRWVLFGIAIPWIVANVFIIWFSMFFMKDTPLEDEPGGAVSSEVNSDQ